MNLGMRRSVVTTRLLKQNYLNTQHRLRITIYQFCLKFNDICSIITIQPVKSLVHCKIKSMSFDIKALRKGSMCSLYFALLQSISRTWSLYCTKFYFFFSLLFFLQSAKQMESERECVTQMTSFHLPCVSEYRFRIASTRCHQLYLNFLANLQFLECKRKTHIFQMMMILLIFNDSF